MRCGMPLSAAPIFPIKARKIVIHDQLIGPEPTDSQFVEYLPARARSLDAVIAKGTNRCPRSSARASEPVGGNATAQRGELGGTNPRVRATHLVVVLMPTVTLHHWPGDHYTEQDQGCDHDQGRDAEGDRRSCADGVHPGIVASAMRAAHQIRIDAIEVTALFALTQRDPLRDLLPSGSTSQQTLMYGGRSGGKSVRIASNRSGGITRSTSRDNADMMASPIPETCVKLGSPTRRAEIAPPYGSSRAINSTGASSNVFISSPSWLLCSKPPTEDRRERAYREMQLDSRFPSLSILNAQRWRRAHLWFGC
jgi:hypothetical protein